MKRTLRYTLLPIALLLTSTAGAQLINPPPSIGAASQLRTTANLFLNPTIKLIAPTDPQAGIVQTFRFKISGLKDQKAVHLFRFTPGCGVERQPAITGLDVRIDYQFLRQVTGDIPYTTDGAKDSKLSPRGRYQDIKTEGIPVDSNGEAIVSVQGVARIGARPLEQAEFSMPDEATLQRAGALEAFARFVPEGESPICEPKAIVMFQGTDNQWRTFNSDGKLTLNTDPNLAPKVVQGTPWTTAAWHKVTVTNTAGLRDLLAPVAYSLNTGSTCTGQSTGPGQPSYTVGVRTVDGDIAFSARSGPLGTRCGLQLNTATLPEGVGLISANFVATTAGSKCHVGRQSRTPADQLEMLAYLMAPVRGLSFSLDRVSGVLRQPLPVGEGSFDPGFLSWIDPFTFPGSTSRLSLKSYVAAMTGVLECEGTAFNDHGVTLRLDSVDFSVRAGVSFP